MPFKLNLSKAKLFALELKLRMIPAQNQVAAQPWLAFVLFVAVCLFVVRQAPPKLTPKAPATFKSRAWDSTAAAVPKLCFSAARPVWSNLRARRENCYLCRGIGECRWTYAKCDAKMPPMGVVSHLDGWPAI